VGEKTRQNNGELAMAMMLLKIGQHKDQEPTTNISAAFTPDNASSFLSLDVIWRVKMRDLKFYENLCKPRIRISLLCGVLNGTLNEFTSASLMAFDVAKRRKKKTFLKPESKGNQNFLVKVTRRLLKHGKT